MRRLPWLIVLLLCTANQAWAQQASVPDVASQPAVTQPNGNNERIASYLAKKFGLAKEKAAQLADIVNVTATKYALPPAVVYAIISIESRFKEKARGSNGATGLMQVVPAAHRGLLKNVKDLTEPTANVNAGSAILSGYVKAAGGDLGAALKSYGGSHAYADKVMHRVESFRFVLEPSNDANAGLMPVSAPAAPASASSAHNAK